MYDNLTTVMSLKSWLQPNANTTSSTANDAEYAAVIQIASELIGRYLNRSNLGAIYSYTENYFSSNRGVGLSLFSNGFKDIVLRHWPVTELTQVMVNNAQATILTSSTLLSGAAGAYLLEGEEPRILKLRFLAVYDAIPIQVSYKAGYPSNAIPKGLQQACNQFASEIFRSQTWLGFKSKSIGGETIAYDTGTNWSMSSRVKAMLTPYQDVVPFRGF